MHRDFSPSLHTIDRNPSDCADVLVRWPRSSQQNMIVIPGKLAIAGATRNPGNSKPSGCPKFTNEVQHLLYKVLRWDKSMNSFHWNNVARLPGIAKPGKQSAKSRQLWIARHRL